MADFQHSTSMSRRQALVPLAAMVAVASTGIAVVATTKLHPDAELLAAWDGYKATYAELGAAVGIDAQYAAYDRMAPHEIVLETVQAKTMDGLLAKLRFCYAKSNSIASSHDAMIFDIDQPADDREELGDILLWRIVQNVRALAA